LDFIEQGIIDLKTIDTLVIDEFDQLLDLGFTKELNKIIGALPAERQTIFSSATKTLEIEKIVRKRLSNPVEINLEAKTKKAK
jgi:ATP-dependent RNA helicase RhlE